MEFFLRHCQLRLEGLSRLSDRLPPRVKKVIREELRSIHSGWTNWYLETGQYEKARESVWRAARIDLTFALAVKVAADMDESPAGAPNCAHHQQSRKGIGHVSIVMEMQSL